MSQGRAVEEPTGTMREAFFSWFETWITQDDRAIAVLADISLGYVKHLNENHPGRILNVGIREQSAIGVAAGLALEGYHPLAHTYAPFLVERPFEMLKDDLFHQGACVTLVSIGASYDEPGYGRTHQCPEDVALLSTFDGCDIFVPGHPCEVAPLLEHAVHLDRTSYLRLTLATNSSAIRNTSATMMKVRSGTKGVVIAVGPMLDPVLEATSSMDVSVLYATTVRPFDGATLRSEVGEVANVILVEPYLAGTSSAQVADSLVDVPHRILALGVGEVDTHHFGTRIEHDRRHGLDAEGIARAVANFLK